MENKKKYTAQELLFTDIQVEVVGVKYNVSLYFPKDDADSVKDKLIYLAGGRAS